MPALSPVEASRAAPENQSQHWCVVGAGFMGLTLAKRLAEAGQKVTLLEAAPEIGGLASAWSLGNVVWDRHYHVTLLSDRLTLGMLADLGLEEDLRWVETKTGFYCNGRLHSMSNSWEFLKFPPLNLWEKLRLAATIFAASRIKDWRRLENILVSDWLERWSGRSTFRKIWQPLLQESFRGFYLGYDCSHVPRSAYRPQERDVWISARRLCPRAGGIR
jgi:protoporphyrinogen oxidase